MEHLQRAAGITSEQLFNATANGIVVTDRSGTILKINKNAANILAVEGPEIIGSSVYERLPLLGEVIKTSLRTSKNVRGYLATDGSKSVVLNISIIRKNNKIQGVATSFQELAVFEKIAKKLEFYQLQNRELSAIFESVSDGIWVCDGNGIVLDINRASEELNEIDKKEVLGKSVYELVKEGMYDRSSVVMVLEKKEPVSIIQDIKRINKKALVTAVPVFNEKGEISLVVVNSRDMTVLNNLQDQLEKTQQESDKLKQALNEMSLLEISKGKVIGSSELFQSVLKTALKLAQMEVSKILLLGESGTGKGLLAQFIHKNGKRSKKPFIQINCAAVPENLLEAELFGYAAGAFTGARYEGKIGLIELAHEGTLFLDEIGELPLHLQSKLLKYFDDGEIVRVGGVKPRKIDCTIIAATNRNLELEIEKKHFRQDLFYRINTFTVHIPPLRERTDDIFDLVNYYLALYNEEYQHNKKIGPKAFAVLQHHDFPGNVRELKNIIKKGVVLSDSSHLDDYLDQCFPAAATNAKSSLTDSTGPVNLKQQMRAYEREILMSAMIDNNSTRDIARALGVDHSTIVRKLNKHNLSMT